MAALSRSQLLVYGAIAVAVLLVGARWLRSADASTGGRPAVAAGGQASAGEAGSLAVEHGGDGVVVHVAGAVRQPGVYRLPLGSRVADAVERAGGPTADALEDATNLAAELADGQQVVLPAQVSGAGVAAIPGSASAAEAPISLGTATVEQLDTVDGIGPVTAQGIVEFRDQQGGFSSVEDLDQISGIGPATMEALRGALQP
jgi:competence protein ComEA